MSLWIILDLVVVAIYVLAILYFKAKGFLRASETVISIILTFFLVSAVSPVFEAFIEQSSVGQGIYEKVESLVMGSEEEQKIALPNFLQSTLEDELESINEAKDNMMTATAEHTSKLIIQVVSAVLLFILVKIGVFILFRILGVICHIKLFEFVNKTLGVILGIINATVIIYILCALAVVFVPVEQSATFKEALSHTYLAQFFYNNNMLLDLFL